MCVLISVFLILLHFYQFVYPYSIPYCIDYYGTDSKEIKSVNPKGNQP